MAPPRNDNTAPVEVWLTQRNIEITASVVYEDETSDRGLDVESLSMRGAQREFTAWMISAGYEPVGRWETEYNDEQAIEVVRRFRPKKEAKAS